MKKYTPLLISLGIAFGVAFLGSSVTTPSISGWYASLNKPSFNPPAWVFAPVWTILFAMMAIGLFGFQFIPTLDHTMHEAGRDIGYYPSQSFSFFRFRRTPF